MASGIYSIYSEVNGRTYIGSAVNFSARWKDHRTKLRRGIHHNIHLQRAWTKHGEDAFEFIVLEECSVEKLIEREQHYMDQCSDKYNILPVAGSSLGYRHTDETLAKMVGNQNSAGRVVSEETRSKTSASLKGSANAAGNIHTPATREKLRQLQLGRKHSPEARANMSAAHKGHSPSPGTREKLRQSSTGRKHTPEAKAKVSAARKAWWAKKRAKEAVSGQTPIVEVS